MNNTSQHPTQKYTFDATSSEGTKLSIKHLFEDNILNIIVQSAYDTWKTQLDSENTLKATEIFPSPSLASSVLMNGSNFDLVAVTETQDHLTLEYLIKLYNKGFALVLDKEYQDPTEKMFRHLKVQGQSVAQLKAVVDNQGDGLKELKEYAKKHQGQIEELAGLKQPISQLEEAMKKLDVMFETLDKKIKEVERVTSKVLVAETNTKFSFGQPGADGSWKSALQLTIPTPGRYLISATFVVRTSTAGGHWVYYQLMLDGSSIHSQTGKYFEANNHCYGTSVMMTKVIKTTQADSVAFTSRWKQRDF